MRFISYIYNKHGLLPLHRSMSCWQQNHVKPSTQEANQQAKQPPVAMLKIISVTGDSTKGRKKFDQRKKQMPKIDSRLKKLFLKK